LIIPAKDKKQKNKMKLCPISIFSLKLILFFKPRTFSCFQRHKKLRLIFKNSLTTNMCLTIKEVFVYLKSVVGKLLIWDLILKDLCIIFRIFKKVSFLLRNHLIRTFKLISNKLKAKISLKQTMINAISSSTAINTRIQTKFMF